MKRILVIALILLSAVKAYTRQRAPVYHINTFTNIPKDMEGCDEGLFLNKQDEKNARFIFYTDYERGLICVNNKMIMLNFITSVDKKSAVFSNKDYTIKIKYGPRKYTGDESYDIKYAMITIKFHSKIIWSEKVIGSGGC